MSLPGCLGPDTIIDNIMYFHFTSPPIYRKLGEKLATQLAQASRVASSRSNNLLEESSGGPKWAWVLFAPPFLLSTPPSAVFWWFFFRKVTETYEFRNDTCFLSVMLRNLVEYIIIPFLTYGMLRNLTNCATMLPFDFRCVTEPYGLCINIFFCFPTCPGISQIA